MLGPVAAGRGTSPIRLGGPKQRAALALLAGRPGTVVSADSLIHALWGEAPPRTAATALHGHISKLRQLLGDNVIVTRTPGYALGCAPDHVDATRFERLVEESRTLAPLERAERLRAALSLWRGSAFADVAGVAASLHELAGRLDELRLVAQEELFEAEAALGRHVEIVAELEELVRCEPTRERAVAQLMVALYRSGRQVDALAAYRRFRQELNAVLALEPTQALRDLERQILLQDPALAPPTALRPAKQRRLPLTVAAVGLEIAAGELDAEAYAHAIARAREAVRLVFERHGAVVERAGSAVVGLFGASAPAEDDAARALAAARAALDAVEQRDGGSAVRGRAGVASGDSFGNESPAIDEALRLQAHAPPGGLEVDERTRLRARPRELRLDRALVGRTPQRCRLRELYDTAVAERRSAVAVLVGPAGIGKSRLVEDLASSVKRGTRILRSPCRSYGDGSGLLPAAELVRGAAGVSPDATAATARTRLSEVLAGDERAAAAVERLLDVLGHGDETVEAPVGWAVRCLLDAVAGNSPTLVLVEDVQWASPAFREVVERLAERGPGALVVVATSRDDPSDRLGTSALHVGPLAAEACAAIVVEALGGEVEPASLQRLVERSGGNPLFLEELVHDLRASGRLQLDGAWRLCGPHETLPQSIRPLLAARVERLAERERDLLTRGSVLGHSFTLAELGELVDDVEESLSGLFAAGLLQPAAANGDIEFRHMLLRDAAYASLPLGVRAELHERVASRLDDVADAGLREREALAIHHLDLAFRARVALMAGDTQLSAAARALAARAASLGRALLADGDAAAAAALLARASELDPDELRAGPALPASVRTGELGVAARPVASP